MQSWDTVELTRDCAAVTVPYGEPVELFVGGQVQVIQRLGGSITVRTQFGTLPRIDDADADALGLTPAAGWASNAVGEFEMRHVIDALNGVYDPEIPVSIVELGLVYRCDEVEGIGGARRIEIDMTMTAPGCGMGDVLRSDVMSVVRAVPGVDDVEVTLVWDPPWSLDLMSEAARLQLGLH